MTRSFVLLGLFCTIVCVTATSGCVSPEQKRQRDFQTLWKSARTPSEIYSQAPAFRSYYPEIVSVLSSRNMYKVLGVFEECGDPCPAVELAPLLEGTKGEQRFLLATIVAYLSGGYHEASVKLAEGALADVNKPLRDFAEPMLLQVNRKRSGGAEVGQAVACDIPLHLWHEMTYSQRWKKICEIVKSRPEALAGKTTGLRDDYDIIVDELTFENWWRLARVVCLDWDLAIALEPYLSKTSGDKRVLLAIFVAMGSYGHHPQAMGMLESVPDDTSEKVAVLARAMLSTLRDIQKTYSPYGLLENSIVRYEGVWEEKSVAEKWHSMKAAYLKLEKARE